MLKLFQSDHQFHYCINVLFLMNERYNKINLTNNYFKLHTRNKKFNLSQDIKFK